MKGNIVNPRCPECYGAMRSSNFTNGARQLKCEVCCHRERRNIETNELLPVRKYLPLCPVCGSRGRRWTNSLPIDNVIKIRCEASVEHCYTANAETLELIEIIDPLKKRQKKERLPKKRDTTKTEAKKKAAEAKVAANEAKKVLDNVKTRPTKIEGAVTVEQKAVVAQREKMIREKIEDRRDLQIEKDPLFDI